MKKFLTFVLVLAMVMSVSSFAIAYEGDGSESNPYLIKDLTDLETLRNEVNAGQNYAGKYFKLAASIDMSSVNWEPIGNITYDSSYAPADPSKVFSGVFDGNGKVLSNLKIEKYLGGGADADANLGLFGIIGEGAVVKNLTITNVDIDTDGRNVGALAGVAHKATIDNITINGNIQIKGGNNVCGVIAMTRHFDVSVTNITVSGNDGSAITGNNIVAGIFAEIAPNGSNQTFSNLSVENVAITGVGGVGGIVGLLTNGAMSNVSVKNVALTGKTEYQGDPMGRIRLGSVVGLLGNKGPSTVSGVTVQNVTGKNLNGETVALPDVGANYDASSNATEARIGDDYYATLAVAVGAAEDGDTITLLADVDVSSVDTTSNTKNLTIVDKNGVEYALNGNVKIYPANLDFGTKQAGYSGVAAQTVTVEGANAKPTITVNSNDYSIGEVQADGTKYTFTVQPKDGLGLGAHNASITVTIDAASPSPATVLGTIEAEFTVEPKPGNGISVTYNGGNSFSTSNPSVPTGVEIDGVPVTFNGTGSNFSVGCISSDAKWVTVRWTSTSVTTNFTPDGLVECTTVSIPKTGDMSFWAAVAAFFGF